MIKIHLSGNQVFANSSPGDFFSAKVIPDNWINGLRYLVIVGPVSLV
jgi:hypothetical protein